MPFCKSCRTYIPYNYNYCPRCGKQLFTPPSISQIILSNIDFTYDKIEEFYDTNSNSFLGLLVMKKGKYGFLTDMTHGLPCEYDTIWPFLNTSPFSECLIKDSVLVYKVRKGSKWGIISFSQNYSFLNRDTGCIFNDVSFIDDFPACWIINDSPDTNNPSLSFFNINTFKNALGYNFSYVRRVHNALEPNQRGVFYACSLNNSPRDYYHIYDIIKCEQVDYVYFDYFKDVNNKRWKHGRGTR